MMIVDTHVHLYPDYDIGAILRLCSERLHKLAPDAVPVACLTERHDCHFFKEIQENGLPDNKSIIGIEKPDDKQSLLFRFGDGVPPLFLIPGRQIATQERIELHCIGKDAVIPDGDTAIQTARRILEIDAVAVLPWGVGKWLFKRSHIIEKLLDTFSPKELRIGDSAMRPWFWPEPRPMQKAADSGYTILAGSDPLPHEHNGQWVGQYATILNHPFDQGHPSRSVISALQKGNATKTGKRPGVFSFPKRMHG